MLFQQTRVIRTIINGIAIYMNIYLYSYIYTYLLDTHNYAYIFWKNNCHTNSQLYYFLHNRIIFLHKIIFNFLGNIFSSIL